MMAFEIDRKPTEINLVALRPMLCNLNTNTRADGSALLAQGNSPRKFSALLERCNC